MRGIIFLLMRYSCYFFISLSRCLLVVIYAVILLCKPEANAPPPLELVGCIPVFVVVGVCRVDYLWRGAGGGRYMATFLASILLLFIDSFS